MGHVPEDERAGEFFRDKDKARGRKAKKKGAKQPRKRYDEEDEWGDGWDDTK